MMRFRTLRRTLRAPPRGAPLCLTAVPCTHEAVMDVLCMRPCDRCSDHMVECDRIGAGQTIGVAIPPRRGCVGDGSHPRFNFTRPLILWTS
eukprot:2844204-Prymnesium_polylepis.2